MMPGSFRPSPMARLRMHRPDSADILGRLILDLASPATTGFSLGAFGDVGLQAVKQLAEAGRVALAQASAQAPIEIGGGSAHALKGPVSLRRQLHEVDPTVAGIATARD
jgi:hypothetical protein